MSTFSGIRVIVSAEAYEMVPIFPDKKRTKRRNRRVIGKYGRLDRMNPLVYKTPLGMVVHPIIAAKLRAASG